MIKFGAWNIRGLNNSLKQKEVISFVSSHSLDFVCILETRVRATNMDRIFLAILPGWRIYHNYNHESLGRIWVCWNPSTVTIDTVSCNDQAMLCHITAITDNTSFFCTAIYASNDNIVRRELWSHIHGCASIVGSNPWFMLGDFNTTRFAREKNWR